MTIKECLKSIIKPEIKLPNNFRHNADFDAALLVDIFDLVPEVVRARNGQPYVYFEQMDAKSFEIVRAMGFEPRMHKSHKYVPAQIIFRAHIGHGVSSSARQIANRLHKMDKFNITKYTEDPNYRKYIENYKAKTK